MMLMVYIIEEIAQWVQDGALEEEVIALEDIKEEEVIAQDEVRDIVDVVVDEVVVDEVVVDEVVEEELYKPFKIDFKNILLKYLNNYFT